MNDLVLLAKERELELVKQASLRCATCRLSFESAGADPVMSALLHTDRSAAGGEREVFVSAPAGVSRPGAKELIQVRFDHDGMSLLFSTRCEDSAKLTTAGGAGVTAWRLSWPEQVFIIQRRAFFRVRASATEPVRVGIAIADASGGARKSSRQKSARSTARISKAPSGKPTGKISGKKDGEIGGILWDISGGALSFTFIPEPAFQIKQGAEIEMELTLGTRGEVANLRGRVVGTKTLPDNSTLYSITYSDMDSSVKLRRSHNLVLQYVAAREREILAQHRQSKRV